MKKIISCPYCEEKGLKQNLAELLPSGLIAVMRRGHGKYAEYTIIGGPELFIICGQCGNKVYIKNYKLIRK
jgi:hypothetical protein